MSEENIVYIHMHQIYQGLESYLLVFIRNPINTLSNEIGQTKALPTLSYAYYIGLHGLFSSLADVLMLRYDQSTYSTDQI
jgi:hypothetical protein